MRVEGKDGLLARASRLFDLPADAVAGVPRVEVVGDGELRMGPHRWWYGGAAWSCGL